MLEDLFVLYSAVSAHGGSQYKCMLLQRLVAAECRHKDISFTQSFGKLLVIFDGRLYHSSRCLSQRTLAQVTHFCFTTIMMTKLRVRGIWFDEKHSIIYHLSQLTIQRHKITRYSYCIPCNQTTPKRQGITDTV